MLHQSSRHGCAGWDRMGMTGYSLYSGNLQITCRFLVVFLVVSGKSVTLAASYIN